MTHITEDRLLAYALEIIDSEDECAEIAEHIAACAECATLWETIKNDVAIIGQVRPARREMQLPNSGIRRKPVYAILRVAAVFILGIFAGFGGSNLFSRTPIPATPAYVALSPPDDGDRGYAVSDATQIPARYYEKILEGQE
jgi:hypothetical protein